MWIEDMAASTYGVRLPPKSDSRPQSQNEFGSYESFCSPGLKLSPIIGLAFELSIM